MSGATSASIVLVTGRADVGGGPEHVMGLLNDLPVTFSTAVAAPDEQPYFDRYGGRASAVLPLRGRRNVVANWWRLLRHARAERPALLHSHGKAAGIITRPVGALLGIPVVHTFHGVHIEQYGSVLRWAYLRIERLLTRWTDCVIAVSTSEAELIRSLVADGRCPVRVVPNGVSVPAGLDEVDHDGELRLVAVARLTYQKHPERLIEAAAVLRSLGAEFQMRVVGDGELRDAVVDEIERRSLGDVVEMRGEVSPIWPELTWANAYLSTARWEGMPIAVLEAMAVGLAPVVPQIGGHVELIDDGVQGLLYGPDVDDEFVEALRVVLDPRERSRLGEAAASRVAAEFSAASTADAVAGIYSGILSGGSQR